MTTKNTYFISDLHLDPSRPHLFKLFYAFIDNIQGKAEALYILGDLFEFWIGDDIIDLPFGKPFLPVVEKLKSLSDQGTKICFIQGNRDFLIGEKFIQRIGATLLPDDYIIDLYGTATMIMHGDILCTDDKAYQRLRTILRWWWLQKIYLSLSPERRSKQAGQVRKATSEKTRQKHSKILDVNQQAVINYVKKGGVPLLIHGHTHRPAEHDFTVEGKPIKRIVLGDWRDKACYLEVNKTNYKLIY
jgi:UDP-2,3-diacylglucosamine hydrolase